MRENDVLFGFRVTRMRVFSELGGALVEMEHEKTGASLCWLNRPDENKAFILSFKTPPKDSTGVFHVLAHSVLRGSDQYQIRDLIAEFNKSSVQTFFNQRVYPDKTVFIGSSRNDQDFLNLLDVDFDAIFHPAIYHRPEIFRQEAWRYELKGDALNYQGIVLNEMKGDAASVEGAIDNEMSRRLFPDICYQFEAGGNPSLIPDLTYEALCDAHRTYYHPSNLRISLVGEIEVEAVLKKIDSYLCCYERRDIDFPIPMQKPIPASANVLPYEIEEDEPLEDRAVISCGTLLGTCQDRERLLAASLLIDYLVGDAEAPLRRAVIDRGLAEKFEILLFDWIQQPIMCWQATNTDQSKLPLLYAAIRKTLSDIVEQGLDHERFEACFHHFAFQKRDRDAGWEPRSINDALEMLNTWLYGGDPADALIVEPILDALSKKLHTGYFEQLIRELFLENRHTATVLLVPSHTLSEEKLEKERAQLEAARAVWTDADYARLDAETEALRAWQQTPDSPEALAAIPKLKLSDLNDRPAPLHCEPITQSGIPVLHHTVYSNLAYFKALFAANDLSIDELPLLKVMCGLLGKLPTALYRRDELPLAVKRTIGRLRIEPWVLPGTTPERCRVLLSASIACTKEQAKSAAELLGELLTQTVWEDAELTRETLRQMLIGTRSPLLVNGDRYALSRVRSSLTGHGLAKEQIVGVSFIRWLEQTVQDGQFSTLLEQLRALAARLFTRDRLTLSCSETVPKSALGALVRMLPTKDNTFEAEATYVPNPIQQEGIFIPSAVGFVATGSSLSRHGKQFSGSIPVLSRVLDYSYLWNNIRMQGGANKSSLIIENGEYLMFATSRDPQPARSIDIIRRAPEFVRKFVSSSPDLTGSILSSASAVLDPLRNAEEKMAEAEERWFRGISEEEIVRQYQQLLNTTPEDLLSLCDALEDVVQDNAICIVANRDHLSGCGSLLNHIISV